jgi:hypothetical protein
MSAPLKKILASRLFGVLTMLPTSGNAASTIYSGTTLLLVDYGERVNEGISL